jgi:hypothetical protein
MFGIGPSTKSTAVRSAATPQAGKARLVELAHVGIHVPSHARVLLSVFLRGIEVTGEAELYLRLHREEHDLGSFRFGALCGATGSAHWLLEQSAFSAIDIMPPAGPCIYRLSAEVWSGEVSFDDAQLWPSLLS